MRSDVWYAATNDIYRENQPWTISVYHKLLQYAEKNMSMETLTCSH